MTENATLNPAKRRTAGRLQSAHHDSPGWLRFLTAEETASLLRTSRAAIYAMIERAQLPGVVRIGRRVLIREADLVEWLRQKTAPFAQER